MSVLGSLEGGYHLEKLLFLTSTHSKPRCLLFHRFAFHLSVGHGSHIANCWHYEHDLSLLYSFLCKDLLSISLILPSLILNLRFKLPLFWRRLPLHPSHHLLSIGDIYFHFQVWPPPLQPIPFQLDSLHISDHFHLLAWCLQSHFSHRSLHSSPISSSL